MENRYQRGKIYKIISPNTDKIYIGSTTEQTLACRMRQHRVNYRYWLKGSYGYVTVFDIFESGDESIILVESYPCNSKDELRAREQHHLDLNAGICVNKFKAHLTDQGREDYRNQKNQCPCGGEFIQKHSAVHRRTKRHVKYLTDNA